MVGIRVLNITYKDTLMHGEKAAILQTIFPIEFSSSEIMFFYSDFNQMCP